VPAATTPLSTRHWAWLLAWWCAVLLPGVAAAAATLDCAAMPERLASLAVPVEVNVSAGTQGWLEIEERGADITLAPSDARAFEVTVPPRYGHWWVALPTAANVRIERTTAATTPAAVRLHLDCGEASRTARSNWYRRAAALSATLMPVPTIKTPDATLAALAALDADAPDASARALVVHLRAQTYYTVAQTALSTTEFEAAENAWRHAGDESRALSARVGRVEELIRAAKYRDSMTLAQAPAAAADTDAYLETRLVAARCLDARYLGDLAAAARCYAECEATFRAGNERVDVASVAQDLAEVQRYLGHLDAADQHLKLAQDWAEGPYAPFVRGRAQLLKSDLDLVHGNVLPALAALAQAQTEFESVSATRWQANTLLRTASLYGELGALEESFAAIAAAQRLLSERDAPARYAAAQVTLARTQLRAGRVEEALQSVQTAETVYQRVAMPVELDITREMLARLYLREGRVDAAAALADAPTAHAALDRQDWGLIAARIATQRNRLDVARALLKALKTQRLSLAKRIELATIEAQWFARRGDASTSQRVLGDAATRIAQAARGVHNALLRQLLVRQMAPLRAQSIALLLGAKEHTVSDVDIAAQWLLRTAVPEVATSGADASRFDAVVAQELLGPPPARDGTTARAGRELLDVLAAGTGEAPTAYVPTPTRSLNERLPENTALLSYVDADGRGALLWVTRRETRLLPGPDPSALRHATRTLLDLVADRGTAVNDIRSASAALSALVLASAPSDVPAVLLVDNASDLAAIPWALLPWPGDAAPLIERSVVSLAHLVPGCCAAALQPPERLRVLVASQATADATSVLDALPRAASEPTLVAAALGSHPVTLMVDAVSDRRVLLDALAQRDTWLHIAAHGSTRAKGLGYSGLWLDPPAPGAPPGFVSALDVLARGSHAALLVLSACDLGRTSGDSLSPNLNFANAAASAGARNVVAALWPISDAATAVWVPSFYTAALAPGHDVGAALRSAQLRLRESRAFRHPYYWASIVHVRSL
jgi:hypothetical protein